MYVRKAQAGSTSHGHQWLRDGQILQVPDEHAVALLAIADAGFEEVNPDDLPDVWDADPDEAGDDPVDDETDDDGDGEDDGEPVTEPAPAEPVTEPAPAETVTEPAPAPRTAKKTSPKAQPKG